MATNQQAMGEFAKTYSQITHDQLLGLYLVRDELLPEARSAFLAELQKRPLTESDAALALWLGLQVMDLSEFSLLTESDAALALWIGRHLIQSYLK